MNTIITQMVYVCQHCNRRHDCAEAAYECSQTCEKHLTTLLVLPSDVMVDIIHSVGIVDVETCTKLLLKLYPYRVYNKLYTKRGYINKELDI